jgi:hypothetical protein
VKALKMQLRPSARLLASVGALALAATLSSCGFNYATDRVYTPAAGTNMRDADVDVLNGIVVSAQEGSGTFVASFANNDEVNRATVASIEGTDDDAALKVKDFTPIELGPGQLVNLATDGGVPLEGEFAPGDVVSVTVTLGDGDSVDMDVPIYPPCGAFEGLDVTAPEGVTYPCEVVETEVEH